MLDRLPNDVLQLVLMHALCEEINNNMKWTRQAVQDLESWVRNDCPCVCGCKRLLADVPQNSYGRHKTLLWRMQCLYWIDRGKMCKDHMNKICSNFTGRSLPILVPLATTWLMEEHLCSHLQFAQKFNHDHFVPFSRWCSFNAIDIAHLS